MPLRRKLLVSMIIPALLLGIVGIVGVFSVQHLKQSSGRILSNNYQSIQEARSMERALRKLETFALAGRDDGSIDTSGQAELAGAFDQALAVCERNITEEGERAVLARITRTWVLVKPLLVQTKTSPSVDQLQRNHAACSSLFADLDDLVALNEKAMVSYERETRRAGRLMAGGVTGSLLAAVLALGLFALISANRIAKPVVQAADRLHQALNPEPGGKVGSGRRSVDEIQRLREELDDLLGRLSRYEDEQNRKLSHMQGRLAFVINEVLEGLVLLDDEFRILAVNRVAREILGLAGGEGQRLADLDPREDIRRMLELLTRGEFEPEHDLGEIRYEVDADERIYRPRVLTVAAADGRVEGYLLLFWDVTEQRRFEESRRRFISMLSHQLKTPMTSLSMSVNLLQEKLAGMGSDQTELLSIATENCSSLSSLISDLIDAARDVTPDLNLRPQRVDIVRLLRSALRPIQPQAEEKGIDLQVPGEDRSVFVSIDPVKFPWVVTNITGNALRYTGRGGRIAVSVYEKAGLVEVEISDTGVGIDKKDLAHIFDPFVSLDSQPQAGTHGLGLAIAREIVEAHNGTISAESETGRGATFTIRLPRDAGGKT